MPLIERIKQLLNMGIPNTFNYVPDGFLLLNGNSELNVCRREPIDIGIRPAKLCLRFGIDEIVFDKFGRRYIVTGFTSINGKNTYVLKRIGNNNVVELREELLTNGICVGENVECDNVISKSERMLEQIQQEREEFIDTEIVPARLCFRFSIDEAVFDEFGRKYIVIELMSVNGKNVYVLKRTDNNVVVELRRNF